MRGAAGSRGLLWVVRLAFYVAASTRDFESIKLEQAAQTGPTHLNGWPVGKYDGGVKNDRTKRKLVFGRGRTTAFRVGPMQLSKAQQHLDRTDVPNRSSRSEQKRHRLRRRKRTMWLCVEQLKTAKLKQLRTASHRLWRFVRAVKTNPFDLGNRSEYIFRF